eukprot:Phypoly_transcript_11489.p1 GENE.Phypoly_transcript_11489~~Phypoly_transcript_11489.p1  ORF type:complete len:180 (+),score=35.43 Phypoly_transcript_11489:599-1138(+)
MISLKQAAALAKKKKELEEKDEPAIDAADGILDAEKTKELLAFFKDKQDNVKIMDLSLIIICLGHNPADLDLQTVTQEFKTMGIDSLPVDKYITLLNSVMNSLFKAKTMKVAPLANFIKVFDQQGDGEIEIEEMTHILSSIGDKLNSTETEELRKALSSLGKSGKISYDDLYHLVLGSI